MNRRPDVNRRSRPVGRAVFHGLRYLVIAAAAVALAPVTLAAAGTYLFGWWRGRPPRALVLGAVWCVPMIIAWLVAVISWPGAAGPWWFRAADAPYRAWLSMWQLGLSGHPARAAVAVAAPAIPLGFLAGALAWRIRLYRMETGSGGRSPAASVRFDAGLWRRQVRSAKAVAAAPGSLPLISPNGSVVTGAVIRAVRHRGGRAAAIPYDRLRSHQVVIGSTGTGKTTLLLRLWAGFMAGGMHRYASGSASRPLLVVLDCKGGASSRKVADRARRVLRDAGAAAVATWPDENPLNLWALPPAQLVTTLMDLIEHGTGGAAYYTDVMEAAVARAVEGPDGPPTGSADFLSRLDGDVSLRFQALWRRLGAGLDGGSSFGDFDAWYCVLEGTAAPAVAEAQARALTDLLAAFAVSGSREILLCVDEYSAVSRRVPIWRLQERARSLGVAIQVSAQSWEGLADTEDERQRVAGTAEGGIWLLRVPRPEPVAALAGNLRMVDTSRDLSSAGSWDAAGSSRVRPVPVVDGDIVRQLDIGQVGYLYRGGVTYILIKRIIGKQAALGAGKGSAAAGSVDAGSSASSRDGASGAPASVDAAAGVPEQRSGSASAPASSSSGTGGGSGPPGLPDVSAVLDEAFGALDE